MFGYVLLNIKGCSEEEKKRYNNYYCGLCKALGRDYGKPATRTLSYDMTFLYLLLSDLYNVEEKKSREHCSIHPIGKKEFIDTRMSSYASAMQILLSYYSALDQVRDDKSFRAKNFVATFKDKVEEIEKTYPRQAKATRENLAELARLEKDAVTDAELPASCFAAMLGEIFAVKEDAWADRLRLLGRALGRFIYFLDAWDDLEKDKKSGSYNPFRGRENDESLKEEVRGELMLSASSASEILEQLPLDDNLSLLRNIIYSGIWTKFEGKNSKK